MPNTISSIGEYAFAECSKLKKISIPTGVCSIKKCAFQHCESLQEIEMSKGIEFIEEDAFEGCKFLEYIAIPKSIIRIEDGAFANCSRLRKIVFHDATNTSVLSHEMKVSLMILYLCNIDLYSYNESMFYKKIWEEIRNQVINSILIQGKYLALSNLLSRHKLFYSELKNCKQHLEEITFNNTFIQARMYAVIDYWLEEYFENWE